MKANKFIGGHKAICAILFTGFMLGSVVYFGAEHPAYASLAQHNSQSE